MRQTLIIVALAGMALLAAAPSVAHHAFGAEFDPNRPVQLKGPIRRIEWTNPHVWFHVEHIEADGGKAVWMVEAGTPNTLLRRGINRNSVPPGTVVIIDGYQAKDEMKRANGRRMTLADGETLFMGSSGTGAPRDGADPTEEVDPDPPTAISVAVSLGAFPNVDAGAPVFVIARDPDAPRPPLAVRRLTVGDLPARIELTDADAMMPGRSLSELDSVELLARVSLSGSPSARTGDLESDVAAGKPGGEPVALRIEHRVP